MTEQESQPVSERLSEFTTAQEGPFASDELSEFSTADEDRAETKGEFQSKTAGLKRQASSAFPYMRKITAYFVAGIGTWRSGNTFGSAMQLLQERFRQEGRGEIHTAALYPYGVMDHLPRHMVRWTMFRQALQVIYDMYRRPERSPAILRLTQEIRQDYGINGSGDIVLIGHSGGGVAAYGAARLLSEQGYSVPHVIQVGSPECHVRQEWRERVYRLRQPGWSDWATWWRFSLFRPPLRRDTVAIEKGHPYYFCSATKDKEGVSNLSKVMDKIWSGLQYDTEFKRQPELEPNV
ncbi:hypothetical protein [Paenibacillus sp. J2TS4]|uniref:hypothetical protein n=1 Tax=Paenibacillus sp. J2TS4 TaxID=2807194 RepID=UPI001B1E095D|nr:hypothetical protein [Paenibacillus sp. J2TS4]GIP34603.1 hypothetical protein J2TS4_38130 [Paenibacillus sp. J2TS4]